MAVTPLGGVASVILAAGASTRMGRPKLLLPAGEGSLLVRAVTPHLEAGVGRVAVVLGCDADAVRRGAGLPADSRLEIVVNPDWAAGLAASLRCGLAAVAGAAGVLLALGDEPGVTAALVRSLVAAWDGRRPLAVPVHAGRIGHPVLFDRALFGELRGLAGDAGARDVVRRHWPEAATVPGEPGSDIDTPEDYQAFVSGRPGPPGGLAIPETGRAGPGAAKQGKPR